MQNLQAASGAAAAGFKYNNREKRRPSIHILPGQVAFRAVCHSSAVGGVIGCNGTIISQLRRDTGTKIHCEAPVNGSEHWIVIVVGSGSIDKRIVLSDRIDGSSGRLEGDSVECDASAAQVALIRVLEKMWTALMENDGGDVDEDAYCGLLADASQIGAVLGKGGRNVEWMRRETGAKIRILPPSSCGAKCDELIQITGGTLAVKKAVITVSGCLQDCPPVDGYPLLPGKVVEKSHNGNTVDPHSEFFPHLRSMLPPMTRNNVAKSASNSNLLSTDAEEAHSNAKSTEQEVVFKMLCSKVAAGGVIGKKGAVVRALQNETGASIVLETPSTASGSCVVTITATENLDTWYSPAQDALVLVFARSIESEIKKGGLAQLSDDVSVNARLLVSSDFVNSLNGNTGTILSEMMENTGANIQILERDQVPDSVSENEVVMEIMGEYKNVQNALFQVTARLRDDLLPSEILKEARSRNPYERPRNTSKTGLHLFSDISHGYRVDVPKQKSESAISGSVRAPVSTKLQTSTTGDAKTIGGNSDLERSLGCLLPVETGVGEKGTNVEFKNLNPAFQDIEMPRVNDLALSSNGGVTLSSNSCHRGNKSFSVRKITLEIAVAEDALGAVYGEDGSGLNNLRQKSGAKFEVLDPVEGEVVLIVSGSPEQTRAAMSLLQSIVKDQ